MLPYFVDASFSRNNYQGLWGVILHVLAWIGALVTEGLVMSKLSSKDDERLYDYYTASVVAISVSFAMLSIATLAEIRYGKIEEGAFLPWLMTIITAGVFTSIVFSVFLLMHEGSLHADILTEKAKFDEYRRIVLSGLFFKIYISEFLKNNITFAGPAEKEVSDRGKGPFQSI